MRAEDKLKEPCDGIALYLDYGNGSLKQSI